MVFYKNYFSENQFEVLRRSVPNEASSLQIFKNIFKIYVFNHICQKNVTSSLKCSENIIYMKIVFHINNLLANDRSY